MGEDGRVANAVAMIPAPTTEQQATMKRAGSQRSRNFRRRIERREKGVELRRTTRSGSGRSPQADRADGAALQISCELADGFRKAWLAIACASRQAAACEAGNALEGCRYPSGSL